MPNKNYSEISTGRAKKKSTETKQKETETKKTPAKSINKAKVTPAIPTKKYGVVTASRNLNVRRMPSVDAEIIGELISGSKYEIVSEVPNWAKVIFVNKEGKEATGFSMVKYLDIK